MADLNNISEQDTRTVTIASSDTQSDVVNLYGKIITAIKTPAALTGTSFTFETGPSDTDLAYIYDTTGTQYSVTVAADRVITIPPQDLACVNFLRITSSAAEGADRTITIFTTAAANE